MTFRHLILSAVIATISLPNWAADEKNKPAKPSTNSAIDTFETDVVATRENPAQSNILSWQSTGNVPLNTQIEFSVLKDSLTPTDRDRLNTEIQYSQRLNKPEQ